MNEKNKSISYSKYKLLKSCQLLFKFNYIDKKFKYVNNEHNLFGIAMHTIIQNALHDFYYNNIKFDINKLNGKLYHEMSNILNSALKSENSVNNINEDEYSKYYDSGKDILNDLFGNMKKFYNYFPKGYKLIENEYYLKYPLDDANINFIGKIDILLYNEKENKYKIIDLKTSYSGWKDLDKKDELKVQQIIFYKYFLSKLLNINIDKIDIEFLVLKKHVFTPKNLDNPYIKIKSIQKFEPASGKIKTKKAINELNEIITTYYNKDGSYKDIEFKPNKKGGMCQYCSFKNECNEIILERIKNANEKK